MAWFGGVGRCGPWNADPDRVGGRVYAGCVSGSSLCAAAVAEVAGVYVYGDCFAGAGDWRDYGGFQRDLWDSDGPLSLCQFGPDDACEPAELGGATEWLWSDGGAVAGTAEVAGDRGLVYLGWVEFDGYGQGCAGGCGGGILLFEFV